MERKKLLILDCHFGTAKWLGRLFSKVETYRKLAQITPDSVLAFEGGVDINTHFYKQKKGWFTQDPSFQRDTIEGSAFKRAVEKGAGIVGICRGAQLATALSGGSLIQHVTGHGVSHYIKTSQDNHNFSVTSSHHQMMNPFEMPEDDYELLAWSAEPQSDVYLNGEDETSFVPEKEPEVVWYKQTKALAIQGHPEWATEGGLYQQYCRKLVTQYLLNKE